MSFKLTEKELVSLLRRDASLLITQPEGETGSEIESLRRVKVSDFLASLRGYGMLADTAAYPMVSASGSPVLIADGADNVPVKALTVDISPVQTGSGDPSPSNVRPISGWTGATIRRTGKNLLPLTVEGIKAAQTTGGTWDGNTYTVTGVTHTILTDAEGTVTGIRVSGTPTGSRTLFKLCDYTAAFDAVLSGCPAGGSANDYELQYNGVKRDFGTGADIAGDGSTGAVYIIVRPGYTASDLIFTPMIRAASEEDSTFEPYYGTTYSVTFPSEAGTVYGGTLDVINGVLTVDRVMLTLDGSETWSMNGTNESGFICNAPAPITKLSANSYTSNIVSNMFTIVGNSSVANPSTTTTGIPSGGGSPALVYFYLRYDFMADIEAWKTWLATHNVQVSYLIEPIPYQLTPIEVLTLLGANTVYADCGDVNMTYRVDPTLYCGRVKSVSGKTGDVELDGGDVGFISGTGDYADGTIGKALRDVEDDLMSTMNTVGLLNAYIIGDKMLVFNQDGTVTWEDAPA